MFLEIKENWGKGEKSHENRYCFFQDTLKKLNEISDLRCFLDDSSIVNSVEFTHDGINVVLDEKHHFIKLSCGKYDFAEPSIVTLCKGDYEGDEYSIVFSLLSKLPANSVFFDVGANLGWYSMNVKKNFPKMTVYSFEPNPYTYTRFLHNLKINALNNKTAFNIGFFNKNDKLDFYYDETESGASSLVNLRGKQTIEKIKVDVVKMDDFVCEKNIKGVDFIKCDVEGAEFFVFKGGEAFIRKNLPIIFSEMLRKWSAKFNYHPNDIIKFFANMGYSCFTSAEQRGVRGKLVECPIVAEETVETNFFFLHKEKHALIIKNMTE